MFCVHCLHGCLWAGFFRSECASFLLLSWRFQSLCAHVFFLGFPITPSHASCVFLRCIAAALSDSVMCRRGPKNAQTPFLCAIIVMCGGFDGGIGVVSSMKCKFHGGGGMFDVANFVFKLHCWPLTCSCRSCTDCGQVQKFQPWIVGRFVNLNQDHWEEDVSFRIEGWCQSRCQPTRHIFCQ